MKELCKYCNISASQNPIYVCPCCGRCEGCGQKQIDVDTTIERE